MALVEHVIAETRANGFGNIAIWPYVADRTSIRNGAMSFGDVEGLGRQPAMVVEMSEGGGGDTARRLQTLFTIRRR